MEIFGKLLSKSQRDIANKGFKLKSVTKNDLDKGVFNFCIDPVVLLISYSIIFISHQHTVKFNVLQFIENDRTMISYFLRLIRNS